MQALKYLNPKRIAVGAVLADSAKIHRKCSKNNSETVKHCLMVDYKCQKKASRWNDVVYSLNM